MSTTIPSTIVSLSNLLRSSYVTPIGPYRLSSLYGITNATLTSGTVPSSGTLALSIFKGATVTQPPLPSTPIYTLSASDLTQVQGSKVNAWGNFTQTNTTLQPTFNIDTVTNFKNVRFTGTSTTHTCMQWASSQVVQYGTNGGASIVLLVRYRTSLVQFNRTLAHFGSAGNARTFECIMGENTLNGMHPKYYFSNSTAAIVPRTTIDLGKWSLYIIVFTNGSPNRATIYKNLSSTPVASNNALTNPLQDSTVTSFLIGSQGATPGQDADIHFAALYSRPLTSTEIRNTQRRFCFNFE